MNYGRNILKVHNKYKILDKLLSLTERVSYSPLDNTKDLNWCKRLRAEVRDNDSFPTKEEFDWSIGQKVKLLKKKYKSDYAIFIYFRDQYSSTERVLYNIVTAVLFPGIIPIGGSQLAFASLVNLVNGEITWFNGYYRSFGDVRDLEKARETVNKIFEEFPG